MFDRIAKTAFFLGFACLLFLVGYAVRSKEAWPDPILQRANAAFDALRMVYLQVSYVHPARGPESGVTVHDPARVQPGLTMVPLYRDGAFEVQLLELDGRLAHRWRASLTEVFGDRPPHIQMQGDPREMRMRGANVLPNGDLIFTFEGATFPYGGGLVRLDKDSNVMFRLARNTHHAVHLAKDGTMWVQAPPDFPVKEAFFEDLILDVAADGTVLKEISIMKALQSARGIVQHRIRSEDPTHLNDVELVTAEIAARFPMLKEGWLVASLRDVHALIAIDPEREAVTWTLTGPFLFQHDVDFLDDGTLLVFDNRGGSESRGKSRILQIDPATQEIVWRYEGTAERPFYSEAWGAQQLLPNGNVLISESFGGRVFEITRGPEPQIVWEFINRLSDAEAENSVGVVESAARYSPGELPFLKPVINVAK